MTARRFKDKVQKDYVHRVRNFAAFLDRSPDTATSEDVRLFQVHEAARLTFAKRGCFDLIAKLYEIQEIGSNCGIDSKRRMAPSPCLFWSAPARMRGRKDSSRCPPGFRL
jgi:hypothetical protein